jgi:hypothetical protein
MPLISGHRQLDAFRGEWSGEKIIQLVKQQGGRVRIDWDVGVGKSHNIDQVIEAALKNNTYDIVIALFPTRQIINERRWILNPPANIRIVNLKPRPIQRCGQLFNQTWAIFEKNGLGALGRVELCGNCPLKKTCHWPTQFGKSLIGVQVVIGTQAHIERSPTFIEQIIKWSETSRALVILDETNFILKSYNRIIKMKQLKLFFDVLQKTKSNHWGKSHNYWIYLVELLTQASTEDLRCYEWKMPWISFDWSLAVQTAGYRIYDKAFHFLAFDLLHFSQSQLLSRERTSQGDISYAASPYVKGDFLIYTGTTCHEFSQYRLGLEFSSPFKSYRFEHPGTVWFNMSSRLGAKKYFLKNSPQILDFFAGLIDTRLKEGKRPLLIVKKCFAAYCANQIENRLHSMGHNVRIITGGWESKLLARPTIIPLISYGMIGTNLFQDFDCACCLSSYYVTVDIINEILQDVLATDIKIPLQISTDGRPRRRKAGVLHPKDRLYDVHRLAQYALEHQEMNTVLQAVGRVRPYTQPREIITFQCAGHPGRPYTKEFNSLGEARKYFGVQSYRSKRLAETRVKIQAAKAKGIKQTVAAKTLGVSLRTIKRHWK